MKLSLVENCYDCIYVLKFPNGKSYVGKAKRLKERMGLYIRNLAANRHDKSKVMAAIREFGIDNVDVEVLQSVRSSVKSEKDVDLCLSILEIKYIREMNTIYPNGYNTSIGGEMLGIPADVISTAFGVQSADFGCKPIIAYDIDGNFVAEYPSIGRCAYALGVDVNAVKGAIGRVALVRNTYMLREKRYNEIPKKILPFKPKEVVKTKYAVEVVKQKVYKKVELNNAAIMYDKGGNYVGLFDNVCRSKKYLRVDFPVPFGREFRGYYLFHYNGGEIRKNIGEIKSSVVKTVLYDDILAYGNVDNVGELISMPVLPKKEKKLPKPKKAKRRVNKYTLDGVFVESYGTITEASMANEVSPCMIYANLHKQTKRCKNFIYRFEGDDLDLPTFSKRTLDKRLGKIGDLFG